MSSRAPVHVLFLHDHLGQTRHAIHGVARYFLETLPSFDPERVAVRLCVLSKPHAIAPTFASLGIPLQFLGSAKASPAAFGQIWRMMRGADVLHVTGLKSMVLGRVAARLAGVPAIVHIHDAYEIPGWIQPIEKALASWTQVAIVPSAALAPWAIEGYGMAPEQVRVLNNGIRLAPYATDFGDAAPKVRAGLGIAADAPVIGIVGRVVVGKGHAELLEAFSAIAAGNPDARLLIVGSGALDDQVGRRAAELGIAPRVVFAGYRTDVPVCLAAMDVVAVPVTGDEGFGFSALEAMAAGKPVVAFAKGALTEVIEDGESGVLVPAGDVAALAGALTRVVNDPDLRSRLGAGGRRRAQHYAIDNHVRQLSELYEDLAANARRVPHRAGAH